MNLARPCTARLSSELKGSRSRHSEPSVTVVFGFAEDYDVRALRLMCLSVSVCTHARGSLAQPVSGSTRAYKIFEFVEESGVLSPVGSVRHQLWLMGCQEFSS